MASFVWQLAAGGMGTHRNGLYRSDTFRYGKEHSHLISTQFKVRFHYANIRWGACSKTWFKASRLRCRKFTSRHSLISLVQESYARQVLPCLDEPAYRAEFNLAVEVCRHAGTSCCACCMLLCLECDHMR
jgi:Peptidase M1 N-terminal domain